MTDVSGFRGFGLPSLKQEGDSFRYDQPWTRTKADTREEGVLTEAILIALRGWRLGDGTKQPVQLPKQYVGVQSGQQADLSPWRSDGSPIQLATNLQDALRSLGWELELRPVANRKRAWWKFW